MSKFKVGDRVRVYDGVHTSVEVIFAINGDLIALQGYPSTKWHHAKQCRRLIKKPKRRVYIGFDSKGNSCLNSPSLEHARKISESWYPLSTAPVEIVEFVEVKKK